MGVARAGGEALRELALEHEDGGARRGREGEELEDERGGDLVGRVGDADVDRGGERRADHVAEEDLEALVGVVLLLLRRGGRGLEALGQLGGHARVQLHGEDALRPLQDVLRQVAGAGADFKDDLAVGVSTLICQSILSLSEFPPLSSPDGAPPSYLKSLF